MNALEAVTTAATAITSVLLVVAGTIKLLRPQAAARSMSRISATLQGWWQGTRESGARGVGAVEIVLGTSALTVTGRTGLLVAGAVVVLFVVFVVITDAARRRGIGCGCWGSLSAGPVGRHEVRRRIVLVGLALVALGGRIAAPSLELLPAAAAAATLLLGLLAGGVLALVRQPSAVARVLGAADFGVPHDALGGQRVVLRRVQREVRSMVRGQPWVQRVAAEVLGGARLDWRRCRVTSPPEQATNFLVAVPGRGASLRIVVNDRRVAFVIGESADRVAVMGASGLRVTAKGQDRPASLAATG
jgi:hypothetical protein